MEDWGGWWCNSEGQKNRKGRRTVVSRVSVLYSDWGSKPQTRSLFLEFTNKYVADLFLFPRG